MTLNITSLIQQKPHLKDPLKLYEKVQAFTESVRDLLLQRKPDQRSLERKAYPPESIDPILKHLSSVFEMPEGSLTPLNEAMKLGEIDFTRLPFHEVPAFSLPYPEEELTTLLFVLSKPYFLRLHDICDLNISTWEEGRCPVCSAKPSLSSIDKERPRQLYCSFCGTHGFSDHAGCPLCMNSETAKMKLLTFDGEEGYRIDTCDACGSYIKTVEAEHLNSMTPDVADLLSLPLDIVVQEKGYVRHSPNPIGLLRMV